MTSAAHKFLLGPALFLAVAPALAAMPACAAKARPRASAIGYTRDAQRLLAQARTVAGGGGWNYLRGWHESGRVDGAPYEVWLDPLRYGLRVEIQTPRGPAIHGFNGLGAWTIAPGSAGVGTGDPGPVAVARGEAFYGVYGYFFPGRFDAHGDYLGVRRLAGRPCDVIEVKPWDSAARQLWFDRTTHLLVEMIEQGGPQPTIFELSDYRKVGPLRVAFRITIQGPSGRQVRQIETLNFTPADRSLFSLPAP